MRKNESGRSMVEMLGVLAIIGVLSIGGIAGYTLSMNRYRANTIVDMANKYAALVFGTCQNRVAANQIDSITDCGLEGLGPNFYSLTVIEGELSATAITETSVTVTATGFPTKGVQDAYAAVVDETSAASIAKEFQQQ